MIKLRVQKHEPDGIGHVQHGDSGAGIHSSRRFGGVISVAVVGNSGLRDGAYGVSNSGEYGVDGSGGWLINSGVFGDVGRDGDPDSGDGARTVVGTSGLRGGASGKRGVRGI